MHCYGASLPLGLMLILYLGHSVEKTKTFQHAVTILINQLGDPILQASL